MLLLLFLDHMIFKLNNPGLSAPLPSAVTLDKIYIDFSSQPKTNLYRQTTRDAYGQAVNLSTNQAENMYNYFNLVVCLYKI